MTATVTQLSQLADGQVADFFAVLVRKEELHTRDGKPYMRVAFRDAEREVVFPIWQDTKWFAACRDEWSSDAFYKIRAAYRETNFGPQLEIQRIRPATDGDRDHGFDEASLVRHSRFEPDLLYAELVGLARERISDDAVRGLVLDIYESNRSQLLVMPAAVRNHHACLGGFLEHVTSVVRIACFLADKYADDYPELSPPLDKDLVIAGAMLHDIGKLRELGLKATGAEMTVAGVMIGHILQGRDMVREAAQSQDIDAEKLLRLEHLIVSHQRLPEWGSPKPPMTPEALIVHYADDLDAKFKMMVEVLEQTPEGSLWAPHRNPLHQPVYRGPDAEPSPE